MSVKKAFDLLETLVFQDVKRKGIRLSDLATKFNIPDNTARNLLKTMINCDFVAQTSDSRYIAGEKCKQIGNLNKVSSKRAEEKIKNALNKFNNKIDETVVFSILSNGYREIIAEVSSRKEVKVVFEKTSSINIYATTTGRVLAAYSAKDDFEMIIKRYGIPGKYWDNIKDVKTLTKELDVIKRTGHVVMLCPELIALACPVLDATGKLIGSVGSHAPAFRCPKRKQNEIIRVLKDLAAELSDCLSV